MLRRFGALLAIGVLFASLPAVGSAEGVGGLMVFANDGTFLGAVTCQDIGNRYSQHGSKYALRSIWNRYGTYGSEYSIKSPYDPYTTTPPVLVDGSGDVVGRLTVNRYVAGAISPVMLDAYLMETCSEDESYRD